MKDVKNRDLRLPDDDAQVYHRRAKRLIECGSLPRLINRYLTQEFPGACSLVAKREVSPA